MGQQHSPVYSGTGVSLCKRHANHDARRLNIRAILDCHSNCHANLLDKSRNIFNDLEVTLKTLARGVIASRATRRSADCLCAQEQTLSMRRCMRPGRGHSDLYQEELLHLSWHGRSGGLRLLPVAATSTHGHEDMTLQRIGNHAPVTPEMRTGCVCLEPRDTQLLNGRI